ncbi:LamG domain-containing protein [Bdellovibrionota bacterium FG-2]
MAGNTLLYHFDENVGATSFVDASGANSVGACSGSSCPAVVSYGRVGSAARFNGTSMITITPQVLDKDFTLEAWAKLDGIRGNADAIFGKSGSGNDINFAYQLIRLYGPGDYLIAKTAAVPGQWTHYAITRSGGKDLALYINGVKNSMGSWTGAFTVTSIGRGNAGALVGLLDEVAIYTRALTANEVSDHYSRTANLRSTFTSRIMDAGGPVNWTSLSWAPTYPSSKELPSGPQAESGYFSGNTGMTDNVLLLHMNETSWNGAPSEVKDSSPFLNHGTSKPGATLTTYGRFSSAGRFDGVSGYVDLGNPETLPSVNDSRSMCAWAKTATTANTSGWILSYGSPTVTDKNQNAGNSMDIGRNGAQLVGTANGTTFSAVDPSTTLAPSFWTINEWAHVCFTYDGKTERLYGNGELLSSLTVSTSLVKSAASVGRQINGAEYWSGDIDEVTLYRRALASAAVKNMFFRGSKQIKFQVRVCDDSACGVGPEFVGPDGTLATYFSELTNSTLSPPSFALSMGGKYRYFQYRAFLESDYSDVVSLGRVSVGPTHFFAGNPTLTNKVGPGYFNLGAFNESLSSANTGTMAYQISNNGQVWYYYNGAKWVPASGYLQTNTAAQIQSSIARFEDDVGAGSFYFKAFLHSDSGTQAVELNALKIEGTQ